MKDLVRAAGTGIFWLLWPGWFVYFKLQPRRSRILVVAEGEVLLVRGWISNDRYGLPGGGAKRHESDAASAVREMREETKIDVPESALEFLGKRRSTRNGLDFVGTYYVLRLDAKPAMQLRKPEIIEAIWVPLEDAHELPLSIELRYALKKYSPTTQESLL